ncbi:MAG: carbohydrate binding domain-containing protein [Bacteroidota bacterium]
MMKTTLKFYLLGVCFLLATVFRVEAQNFSIVNGKFYDPEGKEYIPIGANVNPWNYFDWKQNIFTQQHQDIWTNCWKFNMMRAPIMMKDMIWDNNGDGNATAFQKGWVGNEGEGLAALKNIVNIYTPKKVVVMINAHNFIGRFPSNAERQELKAYFRLLAKEFKNNPYVWFNLINEPGQTVPVPAIWRDMHRELIQVIRDEEGAQNMIVLTGTQWGMEAKTWDDNPIPTNHSAFLTYGEACQNFNGKTYNNVAFDLHLYDQWANDTEYFDTKLRDFLNRCKAKNFALLIGEVGTPPVGPFNNDPWKRTYKVTQLAYDVALKEYGIGMVQWHWDPEDNFSLIDANPLFVNGIKQNGGIHINNCQNPTNLSWWGGFYFWKATHDDGYGLGSTGGTITPPPPPPPPSTGGGSLVTNHEFDNGTNGWSTWGSASLSVVTNANMSGSNAGLVNISNGGSNSWAVGLTTGGISLTNGTTYTISFKAKAQSSKGITVDILDGNTWKKGFYPTISTGVNTYSFTYTANTTSSNYKLNFLIGGSSANVWVDDVDVTSGGGGGNNPPPPPPSNNSLASNPEFDNGTSGWSTWGNGNLSVVNNAGMSGSNAGSVNISNGGSNLWDVGLSTGGMSLTSGVTYTISFMAKAQSNKTITVDLFDGSNWKKGYYPTIGTGVNTYSFTYTANTTSSNYLLNFQLGGNSSNFWIDKLDVIGGGANLAVQLDGLSTNTGSALVYPNPSNNQFYINDVGQLQVEIVDMNGALRYEKEVESSGKVLMSTGLADGMYIIRVTNDKGDVHTQKLVITSK